MRSLQENYSNNDRYLNNDIDILNNINGLSQVQGTGLSADDDDFDAAIAASLRDIDNNIRPEPRENLPLRTIPHRLNNENADIVRRAQQLNAGISDADIATHMEHVDRINEQQQQHNDGQPDPDYLANPFNTPSKLWSHRGWGKNVPPPKEKLPWDCCEVRKAVRLRDMSILEVIGKEVAARKDEKYPVFEAIQNGHEDCASSIISYFPGMIYCKNKGGEPPLCYAVRYKQEYIIEALLKYEEHAPNSVHHILRFKNKRDETPLLIAVEAGFLDIVQLLMNAGSNPVEPCIRGWSAVHEAAVQGDVHILTKLLMSGVNLDIPDCYGCTPLFSASMQGKHEVAELLCQRGANANEKTIGNPATPLHEATVYFEKN